MSVPASFVHESSRVFTPVASYSSVMDEIDRQLEATIHAIDREYAALGATQLDEDWSRFDPATAEEVAAFEARLGARLPDDFRRFLLANRIRHPFSGNFECLDLEGVACQWEIMTELVDSGAFGCRASSSCSSPDAGSA